jgi:hypothetical protein
LTFGLKDIGLKLTDEVAEATEFFLPPLLVLGIFLFLGCFSI